MKIIFVTEYFWPEIGGLEKSTERLAAEMVNKGLEVTVITQKLDNTLNEEKKGNVHIIRYSNENRLFTENAILNNAFDQCDAIYIFGVGHSKDNPYWAPLLDLGIKTFIKIGTLGDIKNRQISLTHYQKLTGVFCQNKGIILEAIKYGISKEKCFHVKNGLDLSEWNKNLPERKNARQKLQINDRSFTVSLIGRIVERKNFVLITQSILELFEKDSLLDLKVLIQGSDFDQHDGEEKKLVNLVKHSIFSDKFTFIPPDDNVSETLISSDVFITMGEREGAPNIILEALATRIPVIASDIYGHEVYIKNNFNGLLIPIDKKSIQDAILYLKKNNQVLRKMSENSDELIKSFDISKTSNDFINVIS